jgi:acetolactate synthase-1/2/3 large subunit
MLGADLFADLLCAEGVTDVMGLTGGCIMEQMDALGANRGLKLHIFQTEAGAGWAAIGYARATGRVGVCVVTSGPAATNMITPLADALRDNVPLVVITGQVSSTVRNTDAFQETNITDIARPTAKQVFYVTHPDQMAETIRQAFFAARSGRPGPVLIDLTRDAQQSAVTALVDPPGSVVDGPVELDPPSGPAVIAEVVHLLREAKRPVVIAGYGMILSRAQAHLRALLEHCSLPVVHSLPGKATLASHHPCNYGMVGMHGFYTANWILHHADLIISLGSRYDDRITGHPERFAPRARRLIHFDISAEQVSRILPERKLAVIGDLRNTLGRVVAELATEAPRAFDEWHGEIAAIEDQYPSTYVATGALQAQLFFDTLNRVLARSTRPVIVTTEIGNHQMWAGQFLHMKGGWQFLTSSGQGAMGSGLPMAIGAQIAHPDALVFAIAGDGSLRFGEAELETIRDLRLPLKVAVLNNGGYGIVRMWNHRFYGGRETGVLKHTKDWCMLASANGIRDVARVEACGELEPALDRMAATTGPCFLEVVTPYEECLPLVPPGQSFEETIVATAPTAP